MNRVRPTVRLSSVDHQLRSIHKGYHPAPKRKGLSSHRKTERKLKRLFLSDRQSAKAARCDSSSVTLRKRQNLGDTENISGCQVTGEGRHDCAEHRVCRTVRPFCVILSWWHVSPHTCLLPGQPLSLHLQGLHLIELLLRREPYGDPLTPLTTNTATGAMGGAPPGFLRSPTSGLPVMAQSPVCWLRVTPQP